MDFQWTDEHRAFRARVRKVLDQHLPKDWPARSKFDNGNEVTVAFSRTFCPILAEEGLLIPHWPKAVGGEGLDAFHHWILGEEMWSNGEPRGYQYMSVNWVGPAILKFGNEEQKAAHISRICAGTISYCQGFSEPEAGSDLASLRTRATETDRGYVINGQKIWTSAASFADYCVLLARTGDEGRKSITVFLVPMDAPGITVRRIPSLQGERALHEVFFDDVEVPASAVLGPPGEGWAVTRQILANERVGLPRYSLTWRGLNRALERMRQDGRLDDPQVKATAARCEAALRAARLLALHVLDRRVRGQEWDASTSIARYAASSADRLVSDFLAGAAPDLLYFEVEPIVAAAYKRAASAGIASGAAEIQLNLIARDHLQMPRGSLSMDLQLDEDQRAVADAVAQLVKRHALEATSAPASYQRSPTLERDLAESDFLNVARADGLGILEALLVVEGLARSPFVLETTASAVVLPGLGLEPRDGPVALLGPLHAAPARFLEIGGSVLVDTGEAIRWIENTELDISGVNSTFGYPMGRIGAVDVRCLGRALNAEPEEFRRLWRLGLIAEGVGAMQAALDATVEHVKTRRQFGRPLGAFQAIQHRLSECVVLINGARLLMWEAACERGVEDSAFAAVYAQEAMARVVYETHQFHGAMGLTLEYPLHYWTYRLRVLQGELGGAGGSAALAADLGLADVRPIAEAFRGQLV